MKNKPNSFISFPTGHGGSYEIPNSTIKSNADARDWMFHLNEKRWFTPAMRLRFQEHVANLGFSTNRNPQIHSTR